MIPVLQELGLRQHRVSRWSCCCLPRLGSYQGADICSHQHHSSPLSVCPGASEDTLGPLRTPWTSEDTLKPLLPREGCAWWAVLTFAVMWMHSRKCCWGVEYRDKCWFPLLPNTGGKPGCFINLPQFPHNWIYKWSGLGDPLYYLFREVDTQVLETSKAFSSLTCCGEQTINFCLLTSPLSSLTYFWLKHLFHSHSEETTRWTRHHYP